MRELQFSQSFWTTIISCILFAKTHCHNYAKAMRLFDRFRENYNFRIVFTNIMRKLQFSHRVLRNVCENYAKIRIVFAYFLRHLQFSHRFHENYAKTMRKSSFRIFRDNYAKTMRHYVNICERCAKIMQKCQNSANAMRNTQENSEIQCLEDMKTASKQLQRIYDRGTLHSIQASNQKQHI